MVQRATEPASQVGITKSHGHQAIVDLSSRTAVLTLYTRGLVAAFRKTRLVDQPDRIVAPESLLDSGGYVRYLLGFTIPRPSMEIDHA